MVVLEPLGDRGFLARFASETEASAWAAAVRERRWPSVLDVVLAYQSAAVFADPDQVDLEVLERDLTALPPKPQTRDSDNLVKIPVLYDGSDLNDVAKWFGLSPEDVISFHSGQEFTVFAIGFQPGFPYAGYLPPAICGLPRRGSPRLRVPAGSVAIAGRQTGIYPAESPGGWHLLGQTPLRIVDLERGHFPIRAGDRIRFVPIEAAEYEARLGEPL